MKSLTYEEALDKIENFMNKSEIRAFCTNICQGGCCGKCFASENACHKNEGRRLSCSVYICNPLRDLLLTDAEDKIYSKVTSAVHKELNRLMLEENVYFNVHNERIRKQFSVKKSVLDELDKIDKEKVKWHIYSVRNMHIKLSRFLVCKIKQLERGNGSNNSRKNGRSSHQVNRA